MSGGDMLDAKLRVSVYGQDELLQFFKKSVDGSKGMRTAISRELQATGQDITRFVSNAARGLATLGGLGASIGFATQAKNVLELRDAIAGLASTAGLGEDSLDSLRGQILQTSKATNQLGMDVTDALEAFVAKTGDIETGRKNLELYGKVATATRAKMSDVANIGAELPKLGIKGDQSTALAILAKQADVGAVELKDMVTQGPRLISAFAAAGLHGEQGLREGGAFTQMAMKGTGTIDVATSATEAAFRDVAAHRARVEGMGINVFDPKTGLARDRVEVIKEMIRKVHGRDQDLMLGNRGQGVFDAEGMRAIQPLTNEFRETGGFKTLDSFRDVDASPDLINKKFQMNAFTGLGRLKASQIGIQNSTDQHFGDVIEGVVKSHATDVAGALDFAMSHPMLVGGGLLAARSGARMIGRAGKSALSGGGVGGALSALAGGAQGAPVFVTNWPGGGIEGVAGGLAGAATKATGALGVFSLAAQNAQGVLASFGVGFAIGSYLDSKLGISDKLSGTSKGAINRADNADQETSGARSDRELYVAQGLAKQIQSGKLTGSKAALQFLASGRNIEHSQYDSGLSPAAQEMFDRLNTGDTSTLLGRKKAMIPYGGLYQSSELPLVSLQQAKDAANGPMRYAGGTPLPGAAGSVEGFFDQVAQAFQPHFTINILGNAVSVDGDVGTRAPKVLVKRSAASL